MHKIIGTITILLGLYIFLRNNVNVFYGQVFFTPPLFYILLRSSINALDGQVFWSISLLFFFELIIPSLFIIGGSFIFKNKIRAMRFTSPVIIIDILKRTYDATSYFSAPNIPIPEAIGISTITIFNPWPSIIICLIEIIVLTLALYGRNPSYINSH